MTLPLDVPTAKPPADLQPANPPAIAAPPPPPALLPPEPTIASVVEPALVQALQANDPLAYFEKMCRLDPHLFFKWAAMITGSKRNGSPMQQNVLNIVTAIPRSPLDELPPGFEING